MDKLLNIEAMGDLTLNELLNQMTEIDSSSIKYIFVDSKEKHLAAVCVFKGEDTKSYIDAIDENETKLRAESAVAP